MRDVHARVTALVQQLGDGDLQPVVVFAAHVAHDQPVVLTDHPGESRQLIALRVETRVVLEAGAEAEGVL